MRDYFVQWLKKNEHSLDWDTRLIIKAFNCFSYRTRLMLRIHYRDKEGAETTRCLRAPKIILAGAKTKEGPAWRLRGRDELRGGEWRTFIPSTIITGW